MAFEHELEVALQAAEVASRIIRTEYETFVPIPNAPASITTHVDHAAQAAILDLLHAAFPDDALCAEEKSEKLEVIPSEGERVWIVDPIDGTRGFAQKNGEFSVMIALVVQGEIAVGVVAEPMQDRVTFARRGEGCHVRTGEVTTPCHVTGVTALGEATLVQSRSKKDRGPSGPVRYLQPKRVTETYSAGVKLARVARGEAELYVIGYGSFHDWDLCAGHILVTEAGGSVTDIRGNPLEYGLDGHLQNRGLVATNGVLHTDALRRMSEATIVE